MANVHFRGVPSRFRDPARFTVQHTIRISIDAPSQEEIKVFEGDVLVWASE